MRNNLQGNRPSEDLVRCSRHEKNRLRLAFSTKKHRMQVLVGRRHETAREQKARQKMK